jgi:hypothetical protein
MFAGMDVHKESIDVSLAEEGRDGEVRHYGVIPGDLEAVAKVVRALRAPSRRLRFVYEAADEAKEGLYEALVARYGALYADEVFVRIRAHRAEAEDRLRKLNR